MRLVALLLLSVAVGTAFFVGRMSGPGSAAASASGKVVTAVQGDTIRIPAIHTRCVVSQEAGKPDMLCDHAPRGRYELALSGDSLYVYRNGHPDLPRFAAPWEPSSQSVNPARGVFRQWLTNHHHGYTGPSICPAIRDVRIPCVAEIHQGPRRILIWAYLSSGSTPRVTHAWSKSWTRRWSAYARPPQHVSPGVISINAPRGTFDWRWLLLGVDAACRHAHRTTCTAYALDGPTVGYPLFYSFHCRVHGKLIACHNKLGDAVRWKP